MGTSRAHIRIERPPDEVWNVVRDPCSILSWMPNVAACTISGDVRRVTMATGGAADERMLHIDDERRRQQYSVEGVPSMTHHRATIDVIEDGGGSLVIYSVDVEPDAMLPMLRQIYAAGLEGLRGFIEGAPRSSVSSD